MTEENKLHHIYLSISNYWAEGTEAHITEDVYDINKMCPKIIKYDMHGYEARFHKEGLKSVIECDYSKRNAMITSFQCHCLTKDRKEMILLLGQNIRTAVAEKVKEIARQSNIANTNLDKVILANI